MFRKFDFFPLTKFDGFDEVIKALEFQAQV